jgi:hypothetical protein
MNEEFEEFEQDLSISDIDAEAIQMHELFSAFLRAGFTEQQGLILVSLLGAPDPTLVASDDDEEE